MALRFASLTKPGSNELSVAGFLAFDMMLMVCAVLIGAINARVLGYLMAVPAGTFLLVGAVAKGIELARDEERRRR